ncbi:MAG: alpha-L-fucosidase [Planctomycetes bacterium]|nr:alpha-L-fucosidase [Planctomycetota bacterium]
MSEATNPAGGQRGCQRLTIEQLQAWERLGYGMFIHFGMSTYVDLTGKVFFKPDGSDPPERYNPDGLDVDQWVCVARDAGMTYAVLTAKHISGFCLWPSRHTRYSVASGGDRTDVVEAFVTACERRAVRPGLYYSSYDNHHRFGSRTRSDFPSKQAYFDLAARRLPFGSERCDGPDEGRMIYTTSLYQSFQTAQIAELLTQYGPLVEVWIDHPDALGRGYRTYLYHEMARLQSEIVVMMNNGTPSSEEYDVEYAWPSDLIAMEQGEVTDRKYRKWRTIEGGEYYVPGEVCDSIAPIRQDWFHLPDDASRPMEQLVRQFHWCREGGANYLLNVPPDRHGVIPLVFVEALQELRKLMGL